MKYLVELFRPSNYRSRSFYREFSVGSDEVALELAQVFFAPVEDASVRAVYWCISDEDKK